MDPTDDPVHGGPDDFDPRVVFWIGVGVMLGLSSIVLLAIRVLFC